MFQVLVSHQKVLAKIFVALAKWMALAKSKHFINAVCSPCLDNDTLPCFCTNLF